MIIGSHLAKLILKSEVSHCSKNSFTTASATISYFARKGELLFMNSDQIEVDDVISSPVQSGKYIA